MERKIVDEDERERGSGRICQWIEASVLLGGECSRWFEVVAELTQGCPSSQLYSVYVMEMLKDLEKKRLGIEVEGTWCGGLLYADDFVLLARSGGVTSDVGCGVGACDEVEI